jgi:hypothetical protein
MDKTSTFVKPVIPISCPLRNALSQEAFHLPSSQCNLFQLTFTTSLCEQ